MPINAGPEYAAAEKKYFAAKTTEERIAGVGVDVVLDHLHKLEKEGLIKKIRGGKRYLWNIK